MNESHPVSADRLPKIGESSFGRSHLLDFGARRVFMSWICTFAIARSAEFVQPLLLEFLIMHVDLKPVPEKMIVLGCK